MPGESFSNLDPPTREWIFTHALALRFPTAGGAYAEKVAAIKQTAEKDAVTAQCDGDRSKCFAVKLSEARRADVPKGPLYDYLIDEARVVDTPAGMKQTPLRSPEQILALLAEERRATGMFPYRSTLLVVNQWQAKGLDAARRQQLIDGYFAAMRTETDPGQIGEIAEECWAALSTGNGTGSPWLCHDPRWVPYAVDLLHRLGELPPTSYFEGQAIPLTAALQRLSPGSATGGPPPPPGYSDADTVDFARFVAAPHLTPAEVQEGLTSSQSVLHFRALIEWAADHWGDSDGAPQAPEAIPRVREAYSVLQLNQEIWRDNDALGDVATLAAHLADVDPAKAKTLVGPLLGVAGELLATVQTQYEAQAPGEAQNLFGMRVAESADFTSPPRLARQIVSIVSPVDTDATYAMIERVPSFLKPLLLADMFPYHDD